MQVSDGVRQSVQLDMFFPSVTIRSPHPRSEVVARIQLNTRAWRWNWLFTTPTLQEIEAVWEGKLEENGFRLRRAGMNSHNRPWLLGQFRESDVGCDVVVRGAWPSDRLVLGVASVFILGAFASALFGGDWFPFLLLGCSMGLWAAYLARERRIFLRDLRELLTATGSGTG